MMKKDSQNLVQQMVPRVVNWYQENQRSLPWRQDKNPYTIWISEIMLQQTRIEAVKGYYARFLQEIPDIRTLAEIPEERLLKLWEGLGYYNRAKNLQKAAKIMVDNCQGEMPKTYAELIGLPGIGEYTAGAIASIAYDEPVPAVDGNVMRVITRLLDWKIDILEPKTKKEIQAILQTEMPKEAGDFNEGIMELGEVVCLPNGEPLCEKCPLADICQARKNRTTNEVPIRIVKTKRKQVDVTVFILRYQDKIAIRKRDKNGLLANLYELPNVERKLTKQEQCEWLQEHGLKETTIQKGTARTHIFSHIEWKMQSYLVEVEAENTEFLWIPLADIQAKYAIPTAFLPFLKEL